MKYLLLPIFLFIFQIPNLYSQKIILFSEEVSISGKIKKEMKLSLKELIAMESKALPDIVITNHLGEVKSTDKGLKGIALKPILEKLELIAATPKEYNEFYFVFEATDGYRVVYSWNELFNTETGNNIYIISEKDGKKMNEMEDRILLITTSDLKTGRRNIKGLCKILVCRA